MKYLSLCLAFLIIHVVPAQPVYQWSNTHLFTNSGADVPFDMLLGEAGNILVTGESYTGLGFSDGYIINYSAAGTILWSASFDSVGFGDGFKSIAADAAGNIFVTGSTFTGSSSDFITVKYDANGIQMWSAAYNSPANLADDAMSIACDHAGNVYITGNSTDTSGIGHFVTIKYNNAGVLQWKTTYTNVNFSNFVKKIVVDELGNSYIVGRAYTGTATSEDFMLVKYDSSGVQQWARTFTSTGAYQDDPRDLCLDDWGNIFVTGDINYGVAPKYSDLALIKYNPAGVQQWAYIYNTPANWVDRGFEVKTDYQGNAYVTGDSYDYNGGGSNIITLKCDSAGSNLWLATYNQTGRKAGRSLFVAECGEVYVTGFSGTSPADILSLKYDQSGNLMWHATYAGSYTETGEEILATPAGEVYIMGYAYNSSSSPNWILIKYADTTCFTTIAEHTSRGMLQILPNPATASIRVDVSAGDSELLVYDYAGNLVQALHLTGLTEQLQLHIDGWNAGVYTLIIASPTQRRIARLVKL